MAQRRLLRWWISGLGLMLGLILTGCSPFLNASDESLSGILLFNEVSAKNPPDNDWIEFFNKSDERIDLSGVYVSDDQFRLTKWAFPDKTYLDARSYLVLVCDGLGRQGSANFKIRAGLEGIYLTDTSGQRLDHISTVPETRSGSYARKTDGAPDWQVVLTPSKGSANQ